MYEMTNFPTEFLWGAATSSFQIEGATGADGRGESIWDRFCATPGAIHDGTDGQIACDHYHRFEEDIALMASLGLKAYRFSIAWPRIVPDASGAINEAGLDFYEKLVDTLLAHGIAPYATLYHWDLPQWLEDQDGWVNRDIVEAFTHYTRAVVGRLGDKVASYATLNEPFVSADHGYREGEHAPGRTSIQDAFAAAHHLLLAHGTAVPIIRELAPSAQVGVVLNFTPAFPASDDPADLDWTDQTDAWENRWYVEPIVGLGYPEGATHNVVWAQSEVLDGDLETIAAPLDFLGVNYYSRQVCKADGEVPATLPVTDMGWEIYPQGIRELLTRLHGYDTFPSFYITENGCAMPDIDLDGEFVNDQDRVSYFREHLTELNAAITNGVPIRGYFAWSLFDNFEWAHGYAKRFGLVRVNYETLERTPKASALWYRDVIAANAVS